MIRWPSGAELQLAHAPELVLDSAQAFDFTRRALRVHGIGIIDVQLGEITVATGFCRRYIPGALAQHDHAVVLADKDPAGMFGDDTEIQQVDVEGSETRTSWTAST